MIRALRSKLSATLLAALATTFGCEGDSGAPDPGAAPPVAPPGPGGGPGARPEIPGGPDGPGGTPSPLKAIMIKVGRGPNALTPAIGKALNEPQPAWDSIQAQVKEYASLAGDMVKHDPPKGTKESWTTKTTSYVAAVAELTKSVEAKNKDGALAAHEKIARSCMDCHREHRVMGPGMGGFGGRGPGGPGGPGGPPGGPGGSGGGGGPGGPPGGPGPR